MAPGVSAEENVAFLVSCIRCSNNGKIDFEAVAKDCGIVTKAAAAKRYERLLKANNIPTSGRTGGVSGSTNSTPAKPKVTPKKAAKEAVDDDAADTVKAKTPRKTATLKKADTGNVPAKKRKREETPEDTPPQTPNSGYQREGSDSGRQRKVSEETLQDSGLSQEVVKSEEVDYYGFLGNMEDEAF